MTKRTAFMIEMILPFVLEGFMESELFVLQPSETRVGVSLKNQYLVPSHSIHLGGKHPQDRDHSINVINSLKNKGGVRKGARDARLG